MRKIFFAIGIFTFISLRADQNWIDEIDEAFRVRATPWECYTNLWPLLAELKKSASQETNLVEIQSLIMTNVVHYPLLTNGDFVVNFGPKIDMFTWIFNYNGLKHDTNAVNYCADYIGTVQNISTNAYHAELTSAYAESNLVSCILKWKPIFSYNARVPRFRSTLMRNFKSMVDTCTNGMTQAEGAAFISNVIERARLNAEEIECLEKGYED